MHDKEHQSDHEQDPGDLSGNCSDAAEAKHPSDQPDNEKHERIVEHVPLLLRISVLPRRYREVQARC